MRIAIGVDHAGFPLKSVIAETVLRLGHAVQDCGTDGPEPPVDYPAICARVARLVAAGTADRGIVVGGSGQGEQIAANKVAGVRAALCNDLYLARLSRAHNDANVLALGAFVVGPDLAAEVVQTWLATPFDGGRHARRVAQITELES